MNLPRKEPAPGFGHDLRTAAKAHLAGDFDGAETRYRHILREDTDSLVVRSLLSHLLLERRGSDLPEALEHAESAAYGDPNNVANHLLVGDIAIVLKNWALAAKAYRQVIAMEPDLPDPYLRIKNPLILTGNADELVDLYDAAIRSHPEMPLERLGNFVVLQEVAIKRGIPGILLVTMPKSGSLYMLMRLSKGLGVPICHASLDLFPTDRVIPSWAQALALGGAVAQEHLDASSRNMAELVRAGLSKAVVHVRDPRQATLSWVHHVETTTGDREHIRQLMSPPITKMYDRFDLGRKIDWQIENYLPLLVKWTQQWMDFADACASDFEVLFTRYEDFRADEGANIRKILNYMGVSPEAFDFSPLKTSREALHRRKGEADEWREVFSRTQRRRATELVPEDMCARFGWAR
ncbi:MAG: sulfotransferase domain-containing protein [Proteobacteria bacterium]|nr:sulfotransferase domain-containing protein [Pseudomonadota bacterium]